MLIHPSDIQRRALQRPARPEGATLAALWNLSLRSRQAAGPVCLRQINLRRNEQSEDVAAASHVPACLHNNMHFAYGANKQCKPAVVTEPLCKKKSKKQKKNAAVWY